MTTSTLLVLALGLVAFGASEAAVPDQLSEWTVDGGGDRWSGSGYELTGTFGQPDPGIMTGGSYELEGGLWHAASPAIPVELQSFEIVSASAPERRDSNRCSDAGTTTHSGGTSRSRPGVAQSGFVTTAE